MCTVYTYTVCKGRVWGHRRGGVNDDIWFGVYIIACASLSL
jgi:hypothetical protein